MGQKKKRCFKCKRRKPLRQFYRHPAMADGHLNKCVACAKRDVKKNYQDNREAKHAYERRRSRTLERRKYISDASRRHRRLNPGRYKARTAVNNAIRDGRLKRGPCKVPGCNGKPQAHHKDYRRPLDVEWICFKHHRELEHGQKTS
jgi:hypothetical protein